jgi:hypothetical protein
MEECKAAVNTAIEALNASYEDAPDFRKTQAIEHMGQALHALDQHVNKIPEGKPCMEAPQAAPPKPAKASRKSKASKPPEEEQE